MTPQPKSRGYQLPKGKSAPQKSDETRSALDIQIGGGHYKDLAIQPVEYITANNISYLEGNVIKYVTRHKSKNGLQDINKAIHYLELIKQFQYENKES